MRFGKIVLLAFLVLVALPGYALAAERPSDPHPHPHSHAHPHYSAFSASPPR